MRSLRKMGLSAIVLSITACTVGPHYKQPDVETPPQYSNAPGDSNARGSPPVPVDSNAPGAVADDATLEKWWLQFHDEKLQSLIERALASNLDLQSAAEQIRQARAQQIIAGANILPTVNATGVGARIHSNSNPLAAMDDSSEGGSSDSKLFALGFDASWELDVFGRARRTIEAARASSDAAVWQVRDAEVSLTAEVAVNYLTLCATNDRIQILRTAIARQQNLLEIAEARRKVGFVTALDVNRQRAQLAATIAQLPPLEAQARAMIHAIAVLLGQQPESMYAELAVGTAATPAADVTNPAPASRIPSNPGANRADSTTTPTGALPSAIGTDSSAASSLLAPRGPSVATSAASTPASAPAGQSLAPLAPSSLPPAPPTLPTGLPSDLLRRRPDIRQAERALAAATAQVGVAVASLYPSFNLLGAANFASSSLSDLLSSDNFSHVQASLIRWPIFQGGKAKANVDLRESLRQQAYLAYQQSVLRALQDAEDSLARYSATQRQLIALQDSETAARSSVDIALAQYKVGAAPFLEVLTAETTLLNTQDQLAQSRAMLDQNLVSVYKALGGGWSVETKKTASAAP